MARNRTKRRFPLNVAVLSAAARAHGDERQIDISRRTGISEDVVSRVMNGRDLSLAVLITLSETYNVPANLLLLRDETHTQEAA